MQHMHCVPFHLSVDTKPPHCPVPLQRIGSFSSKGSVCVRKNAILLSISEGVTLLVADSKAEQSRWHAALNKVINTALTWKQA